MTEERAYDASKHPRNPKGSGPNAGKFASSGGSSGGSKGKGKSKSAASSAPAAKPTRADESNSVGDLQSWWNDLGIPNDYKDAMKQYASANDFLGNFGVTGSIKETGNSLTVSNLYTTNAYAGQDPGAASINALADDLKVYALAKGLSITLKNVGVPPSTSKGKSAGTGKGHGGTKKGSKHPHKGSHAKRPGAHKPRPNARHPHKKHVAAFKLELRNKIQARVREIRSQENREQT